MNTFQLQSQRLRDFQNGQKDESVCAANIHAETSVMHCYMWAGVPDQNGTLSLYTRGNVKLPCKVTPSTATNVKWEHTVLEYNLPPFNIYVNGQIDEKVRRRFSIYNASVGDYSLKILNIKDFDIGRYRCLNQQQLIKTYDIDVMG